MIRITYEFATEDDALRFLSRDKVQTSVEAPKPKAAKKATPPVTLPSESAKADSVPVLAAPPAPILAAPKAPTAPVQAVAELNEAAVRAALRDVVNTKGMKAAAEILKSFSASSISQVKPAQYAEFVKACGQ